MSSAHVATWAHALRNVRAVARRDADDERQQPQRLVSALGLRRAAHSDANPDPDPDPYSDANSNTNSNTNSNPGTNAYANPDSNRNAAAT